MGGGGGTYLSFGLLEQTMFFLHNPETYVIQEWRRGSLHGLLHRKNHVFPTYSTHHKACDIREWGGGGTYLPIGLLARTTMSFLHFPALPYRIECGYNLLEQTMSFLHYPPGVWIQSARTNHVFPTLPYRSVDTIC